MKSFLGNFYRHLAIFSGHTGRRYLPNYVDLITNYIIEMDAVSNALTSDLETKAMDDKNK